ncbi:MAG: hypothetical protein Q9170_007122 [Blastenia crenularia]
MIRAKSPRSGHGDGSKLRQFGAPGSWTFLDFSEAMQAALEELGYGPCYHMQHCFQNPTDCDMWREALEAKYHNKGHKYTRKDWDQLLGHCQAVADFPPAAFIPELHEAYPDAKVVIVQRDAQKWYESCSNTIMRVAASKQLLFLYYLDRYLCARLVPMLGPLFSGSFGTERKDPVKKRENWINGYLKAYEEARRVVPQEKRLDFSLSQGWEPLCKFLGNEVPDKPFPHVHDTNEFDEGIAFLIRRMWVRAAKMNAPYVVAGLGVAGAWLWYR